MSRVPTMSSRSSNPSDGRCRPGGRQHIHHFHTESEREWRRPVSVEPKKHVKHSFMTGCSASRPENEGKGECNEVRTVDQCTTDKQGGKGLRSSPTPRDPYKTPVQDAQKNHGTLLYSDDCHHLWCRWWPSLANEGHLTPKLVIAAIPEMRSSPCPAREDHHIDYKLNYGVHLLLRAASLVCRATVEPLQSVFLWLRAFFYCTFSTNPFGWKGMVISYRRIPRDISSIDLDYPIECRLKFLRGPSLSQPKVSISTKGIDLNQRYRSQPPYYPVNGTRIMDQVDDIHKSHWRRWDGVWFGFTSQQSRRRTICILYSLSHLLTIIIIVCIPGISGEAVDTPDA